MFGWLRSSSKCPLEPDARAWVEYRFAWIVDQFGIDLVRRKPVVLPTDEFFPDGYEGRASDVRALLDRIGRWMDVDPKRLDLQFYSERKDVAERLALQNTRHTLGLYDGQPGQATIWLEAASIEDPFSVVATLAHELAHVRLLGERRLSGEEPDHEQVTDLLTVFFGLGIFTANSVIRAVNFHVGNLEGWSISRSGYLTCPVYGFALALWAELRCDARVPWARHLRPDVREPFQQTRRWLDGTNRATRRRYAEEATEAILLGPGPQMPPPELFSTAAARQQQSAPFDIECGDHEEEIDPYTYGVMLLAQGWAEEAVEELSAAIAQAPDDGEAHLHRALALLQADRPVEALADAHRAVGLLGPEAIEARHVRLQALVANQMYDAAIADAERVISHARFAERDELRLAEALYYRGLAHRGLGDLDDALADLDQAAYRAPSLSDVYLARADVLEQLGEPERAAADRQHAAQLRRE